MDLFLYTLFINAIFATGIIIIGLLAALLLHRFLQPRLQHRLNKNTATLINNILFYGIVTVAVISAVQHIGINLTALLGAAGVAGIAIGFAAKTTLSNMISGFLLLLDKSMVVGNYITVNNTTGEIEAIDLLTTYVRTLDNKLMRIPNENLISNYVINTRFFSTRRTTLEVNIEKTDNILTFFDALKKTCQQLEPVAQEQPISFAITTISDQSFVFLMYVFVQTHKLTEAQNLIIQTIENVCNEQKVKALIRLQS